MTLSMLNDQYDVTKNSPQVKFSDPNALSVLPQVQKLSQTAMPTSCQIGFFNLITSDIFAFNIKSLSGNGFNVIQDANGAMISSNVVVIRRGVQQGSINSIENHLFQGLQNLPFYASQDLFLYVITALVKLSKVPIIVIMHEYAYFGKDKFFQCILCMSHLDDVCLPHLDHVGSSVSQAVHLWIRLKGEQSQGEHTADLDVVMDCTLLEESQGKHKVESIMPMDSSSPDQSQGELPPDQVKIIEMQAVRLDTTTGDKMTVYLFPDEQASYCDGTKSFKFSDQVLHLDDTTSATQFSDLHLFHVQSILVKFDDFQSTCKGSKTWTLLRVIGVPKFVPLVNIDHGERLTCFPFDRGKLDCFHSHLVCLAFRQL